MDLLGQTNLLGHLPALRRRQAGDLRLLPVPNSVTSAIPSSQETMAPTNRSALRGGQLFLARARHYSTESGEVSAQALFIAHGGGVRRVDQPLRFLSPEARVWTLGNAVVASSDGIVNGENSLEKEVRPAGYVPAAGA